MTTSLELLASSAQPAVTLQEDQKRLGPYDIKQWRARRGTWGAIHKVEDPKTGFSYAFKELQPTELALLQQQERALTNQELIDKEELPVQYHTRLVPRQIITLDGMTFVKMPWIDRFLDKELTIRGILHQKKKRADIQQVLSYTRDIAIGLQEFYHLNKRAHGDIKEENISIITDHDKKIALLNDFGTSTVEDSTTMRSNSGAIVIRAPEVFHKQGRPTRRGDLWSLGSLLMRMSTGKYAFEDELKDDPYWFAVHTKDEYNDHLRQKIKTLPRPVQKVTAQLLAYDPRDRPYDIQSVKDSVTNALERFETRGIISNVAKNMLRTTKFIATMGIGAALTYGIANLQKQQGVPVYRILPEMSPRGTGQLIPTIEEFSTEKVTAADVPTHGSMIVTPATYFMNEMMELETPDSAFYALTQHRTVRTAAAAYFNAREVARNYDIHAVIEEKYAQTLQENRFDPADKRIDVGDIQWLLARHLQDYTARHCDDLDLEDFITTFIFGEQQVDEAKARMGSGEYNHYKYALDTQGERMISPKQIKFIDTWLTYLRVL